MKITRFSLFFTTLALAFASSTAYAQKARFAVDTTYNVRAVYDKIRKNFPEARIAVDSLTSDIKAWRNVTYLTLEGGERTLELDVFRQKGNEKKPALIMVHGGGWRSGDRSMQVPMAQKLAQQGFVTIPVSYQLSLEAKYPAALHNLKAAVRWVKAHADDYGIDTTKIAISGCSAGGQLASLVGLTNGQSSMEGSMGELSLSSDVHAIVDIDGVIDFLAPASLNLDRKSDSPDVEWLEGTFLERPDRWKEASSIFWATEKTAIPMLFINSVFSRFHAGQDELIGMMKEWGVYTDVKKVDVQVHPFWLFHPWMEMTTDWMASFLHTVLDK